MRESHYQISTEGKAVLNIAVSSKIPLIAFFSLSKEEQLDILPILSEEKKYDFPDGDYLSSSALAILLNAYESSCLNSISLNLMWMIDTNDANKKEQYRQVDALISELHSLVNQACNAEFDWNDSSIEVQAHIHNLPQVERIRELSNAVMTAIGVEVQLTKSIMQACIDSYIHT
ncbi:MAG: hypothetical protein AAFQ63_09345 [Cyanobacteria bacterium J06621_11]